jgi:hypothetical protein
MRTLATILLLAFGILKLSAQTGQATAFKGETATFAGHVTGFSGAASTEGKAFYANCAQTWYGCNTLSKASSSPLNSHQVSQQSEPYSFWAFGHIYGTEDHPWPAATWLSHLPQFIGNKQASFMVLMGDTIFAPSDPYWPNFLSLTQRFPYPVFNATGNHERHDAADWNRRAWGAPDTYFRTGHNSEDIYFILDTQGFDQAPFTRMQAERLIATLHSELSTAKPPKRVFIFMHKVVWARPFPTFSRQAHSWGPSTQKNDPIWESIVQPALESMTQHISIYVGSGDIGRSNGPKLFYSKHRGITYFAAGLHNTYWDAGWYITVPLTQPNLCLSPIH